MDEKQIESEVTPLNETELQAARQLMEDGAEFDKVRNALAVWFHKNYDVIFTRHKSGWGSKQQNKSGSYQFHRSFHEMLQVLLDTYVTPAVATVQAPALYYLGYDDSYNPAQSLDDLHGPYMTEWEAQKAIAKNAECAFVVRLENGATRRIWDTGGVGSKGWNSVDEPFPA